LDRFKSGGVQSYGCSICSKGMKKSAQKKGAVFKKSLSPRKQQIFLDGEGGERSAGGRGSALKRWGQKAGDAGYCRRSPGRGDMSLQKASDLSGKGRAHVPRGAELWGGGGLKREMVLFWGKPLPVKGEGVGLARVFC